MMRLPLVAVFGLAAAVTTPTKPKTCTDDAGCAADEFCRTAVAASGASCDATLPKTCVKRAVQGASCDGGGGKCFRGKCLTTLACRPNSVVRTPALPGTCAVQCDAGSGVKVFEGWTGPVPAVPGKNLWCHTRYCDNKGAMQTTGGDATAACPTDLASGLRCCPGAGDAATQACCGATGSWVTKDKVTGKVTCAHVEEAHGGPLTLVAPFGKTCTASCPAIPLPAPGIPAHDDGWTGYSPLTDKWCNKCLCSKGATQCLDRPCPALRCCPPAAKKADQVCCGATGEWVTKDKDDKVACGGVTLPYADGLATQPFHAACAADRDCVVGTTKPPVTIPHGKTVRHPIAERGCNTCTCTDGKLVCETALCPPAQCCRGEKPAGTQVCCGLDGLWKPVDTTAKCGASVPTQVEGGGAATGYPFGAACVGCEANVYDKTAWKKRIVSVGWTGPKETGVACDTCSCKVDGDPTVCTDLKACPAVRCCGAAAPAPAADYVCCGATGRWVRKGAGDAVVCDGVAFVKGDPNTDALLGAACAADVCTLTGAEKVADGWVGRNTGADWCQLCRCDDKATPKLACTKNKCALRCCAGPKPTTPGTWKCCGATGVWVRENAAGDYSCGGVTLKTGVPLSDTECTAPATTKCTLHNAGATEVEQGWSGPGLGATNWCRACKCGAAQAGGAVACPAVPTCPAVEKLRCCGKEKTDAAHVCCGLTGEWVAADAQCGVVDLGVAGTAAAPVSAACPECTLYGTTKVAVGWRGFVPGTNWCNKCLCTRDGNLKCSTRTCPALTCCAAAKVGTVACCGTTGEWVAESSPGKYTCAHVTVEDADKLRGPFADACAGTCTLADGTTKVAVGWAGKKGDGCNYCKCVTAGDLQCSARACQCGRFDCTPPLVRFAAGACTGAGGACQSTDCCRPVCAGHTCARPMTPKAAPPAMCAANPCTNAECCDAGAPAPDCTTHVCAPPLVRFAAGVCTGPGGVCMNSDCCRPVCAGHTCAPPMTPKAAPPAMCAANPCTNAECCDAGAPGPGACAGFLCPPPLVKFVAGVCPGAACTMADCCRPDCKTFPTCLPGTMKKIPPPPMCVGNPCTNAECCDSIGPR